MTPLWRYLTQPAGMTAQALAEATGMTIHAVRADLVELEAQGKASRVRGPVGTPHRWWRAEKRPLDGLDVLLIMALAAEIHPSAGKLKEVLASAGSRAKHSGLKKIVAMCAVSKAPHQVVRLAVQEYDAEAFAEAQRAA
jgi:predicted ArsR family transcriptional regulator